MNWAHVHLFLNHIPVLGTLFGVVFLALAMRQRDIQLLRSSLGVFVVIAVAALAVYLTGKEAEDVVKHLPGVSQALIDQHEDMGLIAMLAALPLGLVALGGLVRLRTVPYLSPWWATLALILALVVSSLMVWTSYRGGQIRHTEIRSAGPEAKPSLSK